MNIEINSIYDSIFNQYEAANSFGNGLGMVLTSHKPGTATYELTITKDHLATPIAAHGGVIAAFMDGLLGVTALTAVASESKVVATVEFKVNFLEPVVVHDLLKGTGNVVRKGSRLVMVEGGVYCEDKLVATGTGTFNAYPAEKAGIKMNEN